MIKRIALLLISVLAAAIFAFWLKDNKARHQQDDTHAIVLSVLRDYCFPDFVDPSRPPLISLSEGHLTQGRLFLHPETKGTDKETWSGGHDTPIHVTHVPGKSCALLVGTEYPEYLDHTLFKDFKRNLPGFRFIDRRKYETYACAYSPYGVRLDVQHFTYVINIYREPTSPEQLARSVFGRRNRNIYFISVSGIERGCDDWSEDIEWVND